MDDFAEPREVDGQDVGTPSEHTPEDGEPTSFAGKVKIRYERHKPAIRVALGVTLAVGLGLIVAGHEGQSGENCDAGNAGELESVSDYEAAGGPRQSAVDLARDPFLRRLPKGQHPSEAARLRYRELTGLDDLPAGYTLVRRWFFQSWGDEDSGEAAA